MHHMNVKSAFLNGDLKEELYVHQPSGFVIPGKANKVLRLRKALYGLRQAPELGMPSWTPTSSKWGSSRVLTRQQSTGRAREAMPCW